MKKNSFTFDVVSGSSSVGDGRVLLNTALLKRRRQELGLSQLKLAELAKDKQLPLSIASIKRAEMGEPVIYRTAQQLAIVFDIGINALLAEPLILRSVRRCQQLPDERGKLELVGRRPELYQAHSALRDTLETQEARLVYVRGIAGIGKSCLLDQVALQASALGFDTKHCAVPSPLLNDNNNLLGLLTNAIVAEGKCFSAIEVLARIARFKLEPSLRCQMLGFLGVPLSESDQQLQASMTYAARREKERSAVCRMIEELAGVQPICVLIDDLHWADAISIQALGSIIYELRKCPVTWIVASRHEQDLFELHIRPYIANYPVRIIELAPFDQREARAMAQKVLPEQPERHQAMIDLSQGNPLFLIQLLLSEDVVGFPRTLVELIEFKLSSLEKTDRKAIEMAAAIRGDFSLEMLRELLRLPNYTPIELVRNSLLRCCADSHFSFVHDLVMQGIAMQTAEDIDQEFQSRIAQYYAGQDERLHAIYLTKAKGFAAPQAVLAAVQACHAKYRFEEAIDLLRLYEKIDFTPVDRYQYHLMFGRVLVSMGESKIAFEHQGKALALADNLNDELVVAVELARTLNLLDELEQEEALLTKYIPLSKCANNYRALGQLLQLQGNLYFPRGDYMRSRALHLAARRVSRRMHDPRTEALALSGLGDSYYAQGHMQKSSAIFRTCLNLCESHGLSDVEASNRFMLATTRLYLNETSQALHDALACAELGGNIGSLRAEIVSRLTAGWLYSSMGSITEALVQYDKGLKLADMIGAKRFIPFLLEGVAKCHHIAGNAKLAKNTIRSAWSLIEEHRLCQFIGPWILGTRATIERDESLRSQAIEMGLKAIQKGTVAHNYLRFFVAAGESTLQSRDPSRASYMADLLERFTSISPSPWADYHVQLLRLHIRIMIKPSDTDMACLERLTMLGEKLGLAFVAPYLHRHLQ